MARLLHPVPPLRGAALGAATAPVVQRQDPPTPTPSGGAADAEKQLLEREDKALVQLAGLAGSPIASFAYESPMSQRHQPPNTVPTATLTMGSVAQRPTSDAQKRRSFGSQAEATAFAAIVGGPSGAVVLSVDSLWFVARLTAASASEFTRENVWRFTPKSPAVAAVAKDGFVFVKKDYTPKSERAGKVDRPEEELAAPPSAEELRKIVGIAPEDQRGEGQPPTQALAQVPPGQEESFIRSYFVSRALEALDQNRAQADKLAEQFKPKAKPEGGSAIDPSAQQLIDQTRELGPIFKQLEAAELKLGEHALWLEEKHHEGKWRITIRGQRKGYHEWRDEIDQALRKIAESKQSVLSRSPLLATMVRHEETPRNAEGWGAKLGSERFVEKWLAPLAGPGGKLAGWAWDKLTTSGGPPKWEDSPFAKSKAQATEEENVGIATEFRTKLDAIQRAISETRAKVTGDPDFVLGMSSLRGRVTADLTHIDPKNKALKDALQKVLQDHDMREDAIKVAELVVQVGALFLPGGQFISAAIGLGIQAKEMGKNLDAWTASQATVDPARALVNQQEAERQLLMDTVMMAIQAVELAANVKGALEAVEAGRLPKGETPKVGEPEPPKPPPPRAGPPRPEAVKEAGRATTKSGGHVHVLRDGRLFSCTSPCMEIRVKYGDTLARNGELMGHVERLEQKARGLGTNPRTADLDAIAREVASLDEAIVSVVRAERVTRVKAWLPGAQKRFPILKGLDDAQILRIVEKTEPAHLKGQLFEELMAARARQMLETAKGRKALAGARAGEQLEFIPGHVVRDAKGRQFSDGLLVIRRGDELEVVAILEAKAGRASSRGLKSAYTSLKELDDEQLRILRMEAIEELRATNPRRIPGLEYMSSEDIDLVYKADVDRIIDRLPKSEGGQIVKDVERLGEGGMTVNGRPVRMRGGRGSTKVVGAVPDDVSTEGLKKAAAKEGVQFDTIDVDVGSKELNTIADEMAAQAKGPQQTL